MPDQRRYWLGFHLTKGIGPARIARLLDYFGDLATAWEAIPRDLEDAGMGEGLRANLAATRRNYDLDRELDRVAAAGVTLRLQLSDPLAGGGLLDAQVLGGRREAASFRKSTCTETVAPSLLTSGVVTRTPHCPT